MGRDLNQISTEYMEVFTALKKKLKWGMADTSSIMMISSLYSMKAIPNGAIFYYN